MSETTQTAQEPQKIRDWRLRDLYKNSWQLVKKHKVLWLFGIAVGASSYSSNSSTDQKDIESLRNLFQNTEKSAQDLSMVLGDSTNTFQEMVTSLFAGIPGYFFFFAIIEALFILFFALAVSIIYQSWAEGGLIAGIQSAVANGKVSIRESSEKAIPSIKAITLVRYVPNLIFAAAIVLAFLLFGLTLGGPFGSILIFLIVVLFVLAFVLLSFSQIWAVRKIVLEHLGAKQSLSEGYSITKHKFWAMLKVAIVNWLVSVGMIAVLVIPTAATLGGGMLLIQDNPSAGISLMSFGLFLGVILLIFYGIVQGVVTAFTNTVWSLAYLKIKGKYDK